MHYKAPPHYFSFPYELHAIPKVKTNHNNITIMHNTHTIFTLYIQKKNPFVIYTLGQDMVNKLIEHFFVYALNRNKRALSKSHFRG